MKSASFISLLLALVFWQQSAAQKLYGCVYEQNSGKKIVPGVTITPAKGNPIVSGTNGRFTVIFPDGKPGVPVQMDAQKAGWRIVNPSDLEAILPIESISYLHGIVMCRESEWKKQNADLSQTFTKFMAKMEKKIDSLGRNNRPTEAQIVAQKQRVGEIVAATTSVNQDMVSDSERIAYRLVRQDSIEKAIQLRAQLESEKNFDPALDAAQSGDTRNLEIHRRNLVEQSRLAQIEFAFDKADSTLAFLAMHDSLEFKSVYEYASFLQQQQQYDKAIEFCKKAAAVAQTVFEKMRVWNNIGELYQATNAYPMAEQVLNQALDSTRLLADSNLAVSEAYRAITLNNLGRLYKARENYPAAEKAFKTVLNIRNKQVVDNPELFRPQLAAILLNLGALYNDNGSYEKAEKSYSQALGIFEALAAATPNLYDRQIATLHNNLGLMQTEQKNFGSAETHFNKALSISRRLAEASPLTAKPDVAETLTNLGDLYRKTKDYQTAEQNYQAVLLLRQELALSSASASAVNNLAAIQHRIGLLRMDEKDPLGATTFLQSARQTQLKLVSTTPLPQYGPLLANIEYSLGELYRQQKDATAAEKMYQHALDVRKQLADSSYSGESKKAMIYWGLGVLYQEQKNYSSAEANLQQSYDLYKRLSGDSTEAFVEDAAHNTLMAADQLATTLFMQERYDAAARMQQESITLARQLAVNNPGVYEGTVADLQLALGNTYFRKKEYPTARQAYWNAAMLFQKLKAGKPTTYGTSFCRVVVYLGKLETVYKIPVERPIYLKMLAEAIELEPTLTDATLKRQLKEVQRDVGSE